MGKIKQEVFVPRNGRITVKQDAAPTTVGKSGRLVIPEGQLQKPQRATLHSIDPDVNIEGLKPGASILISKASGWEFMIDNTLYKMMHYSNVWGTFEMQEVDEEA